MQLYPLRVSQSSHEFDDLLDKVPRLQNRTAVTELSGGLTNRNLKISTASGDYVARISSNKSSLLAIDRRSEYENSKIAAINTPPASTHNVGIDCAGMTRS